MKRFSKITAVLDTSLIATIAITGGISIGAIASGIGLPVGIGLSAISLFLPLATTITRKKISNFNFKKKKCMTIFDCLPKVNLIVSVELFLRQYKMKMFPQQSFIRFYRRHKIIVNLKQILVHKKRQNKQNFQKNSVKKY